MSNGPQMATWPQVWDPSLKLFSLLVTIWLKYQAHTDWTGFLFTAHLWIIAASQLHPAILTVVRLCQWGRVEWNSISYSVRKKERFHLALTKSCFRQRFKKDGIKVRRTDFPKRLVVSDNHHTVSPRLSRHGIPTGCRISSHYLSALKLPSVMTKFIFCDGNAAAQFHTSIRHLSLKTAKAGKQKQGKYHKRKIPLFNVRQMICSYLQFLKQVKTSSLNNDVLKLVHSYLLNL